MQEFIMEHMKWVFGGIGTTILAVLCTWYFTRKRSTDSKIDQTSTGDQSPIIVGDKASFDYSSQGSVITASGANSTAVHVDSVVVQAVQKEPEPVKKT